MIREYRFYLKDIIDCIEKIFMFTEKMNMNDIIDDDKTLSAVIRKLEIIGEASKKIPIEIKNNNPDIPWKEMAGMRDKLIHDYFSVDYEILWNVIKKELPLLISKIRDIQKSQ